MDDKHSYDKEAEKDEDKKQPIVEKKKSFISKAIEEISTSKTTDEPRTVMPLQDVKTVVKKEKTIETLEDDVMKGKLLIDSNPTARVKYNSIISQKPSGAAKYFKSK